MTSQPPKSVISANAVLDRHDVLVKNGWSKSKNNLFYGEQKLEDLCVLGGCWQPPRHTNSGSSNTESEGDDEAVLLASGRF